MALSNVELYEALKDTVGEKAARLMAEVIPAADDLARRSDIAELRLAIARLETEVTGAIGGLRTEIKEESKQTMRWMLTFFVPLWIGTWGTMVAVLFKH